MSKSVQKSVAGSPAKKFKRVFHIAEEMGLKNEDLLASYSDALDEVSVYRASKGFVVITEPSDGEVVVGDARAEKLTGAEAAKLTVQHMLPPELHRFISVRAGA